MLFSNILSGRIGLSIKNQKRQELRHDIGSAKFATKPALGAMKYKINKRQEKRPEKEY
jgi:hypothetical protein